MPLRLHAITPTDVPHDETSANGDSARQAESGAAGSGDSSRVAFRELCAIVSKQPTFAAIEMTPEVVASHRAIVDAAFKRAAVLPAPVGVVFREADVLKRWMELHYVSLTSALEFVEDRAVARVHILRADGRADDLEPDSDLASQAAEATRALRRRAVAGVPLRTESAAGVAPDFGASFLVECATWKEFMSAAAEQQDAHHLLRFDVTGPWAPYDFVRMHFGA